MCFGPLIETSDPSQESSAYLLLCEEQAHALEHVALYPLQIFGQPQV